MDTLLSIGQVAILLQIPKSTIYQWIKQNKLISIRLGKHRRFHQSDIEKFLYETYDHGVYRLKSIELTFSGTDSTTLPTAPRHGIGNCVSER